MKNNKQTKQWEESPVREKIRSKRKNLIKRIWMLENNLLYYYNNKY